MIIVYIGILRRKIIQNILKKLENIYIIERKKNEREKQAKSKKKK